MSIHPILFQADMIRALIEKRKTQTRRIIKQQTSFPFLKMVRDIAIFSEKEDIRAMSVQVRCPYGQAGDLLWVRETVRAEELPSGLDGVRYFADGHFIPIANTIEAAGRWMQLRTTYNPGVMSKYRPSIHMPRWCSRITLKVTEVRAERFQDISAEDAIAEGAPQIDGVNPTTWYHALFEKINQKWMIENQEPNPMVWAVTFSVYGCNVSQVQ